jgi:hypothetical protein
MGTLVPQVAVDAVTFLMGKGITKDVAVGIVSVLYAGESALNPGSQGAQSTEMPGALNPSGAYGIASWNGPRQAALQAFATKEGLPVGAVNTQLAFVLTESANSYPTVWAAIQKAGMTYANFIPIFVESYESPANPTAEISRSLAFAATLYPAVPAVAAPAPIPPTAPQPAPAPQTPVASKPASTAPTPTPTLISQPSPPTASTVMDPALAAFLTTVVEAFLSGLLKAAVPSAATATPAVAPVATTSVVSSGTSPLVPVANLEQIIAAIIPTVLASVAPKL